jgi:tellurite resistance protein TerC
MFDSSLYPWIGFNLFILFLLLVDLGLFSRKAHAISLREAAVMSALWIGVALAFNVFVYFWKGATAGIEFFTAWLLEKSLSVDNLFVFLVIFTYFKVEPKYQRRVLLWGILGALIMRGIFIAVGTTVLNLFHPIIYVFGAFLVYTGWNLWQNNDNEEADFSNSPAVRFVKRLFPMTDGYREEKFFVVEAGKRFATPLLLVLATIEFTDLLFAVDSIPAVIGVTKDPFIVYSSNVMAILGLRALYFLLAGVMDKFHYLKYALAVILIFVGLKMMTEDWLLEGMLGIHKEQMVIATLGFVVVSLTVGIVASLANSKTVDKTHSASVSQK